MLRFFRVNDSNRLIVIFLILIVLRSILSWQGVPLNFFELKWLLIGQRMDEGFMMYKEIYDYCGPLSVFMYWLLDALFGKSLVAHHIISSLLIFLNAVIFNLLLIRNRVYKESSYLPALFFVLMVLAFPDFMALSPQLMAMTFILLALNNVFKRIANEVTDDLFLIAGLYLGIAVLFYPPAIVFFVSLLLSFFIFSTPILRRVALYFNGFFIPLVMAYCFYYWNDSHYYAWDSLIMRGFFGSRVVYFNIFENMKFLAIPIFWGLYAMLNTFAVGRLTSFQLKIAQTMLLIFLSSLVVIWLDVEFSSVQLLFFGLPMSFFLTHYILSIKKRRARAIIPNLIFISLIITPYIVYNQLQNDVWAVTPKQRSFSESSFMILSDRVDALREGDIRGPFFDPALSKQRLKELSDPIRAAAMIKAIDKALPTVIIDDWSKVPLLFRTFPDLGSKYELEAEGYYRKISN